jgi:hypothetical protein
LTAASTPRRYRSPGPRNCNDDKNASINPIPAAFSVLTAGEHYTEPFGLVMIEAMACGTQVIAFRCGSVPEVMKDGVSGFVVDDLDSAVALTPVAMDLPRQRVRSYFESRFLAERMARDYVSVYEALRQPMLSGDWYLGRPPDAAAA